MAERSFEELVRDELAGLQLKPDEEIWLNVEAALHTKKERRWIIWLAALLAGCGSFWLYHQYRQENDNRITQNGKHEIDKSIPMYQLPAPVLVGKDHEKTSVNDKAVMPVQENKRLSNTYLNKTGDRIPDIPFHPQPFASPTASKPAVAEKQVQIIVGDTALKQSGAPVTKTSESTAEIKSLTKVALDSPVTVAKDYQELPMTIKQDTLVPINSSYIHNTVKAAKKTSKRPWQFYGTIDLGSSGKRGPFAKAGNVYAQNPSNITGGAFNQGNAIYKIPSQADAFSFSLGLQANKPVGKKSSVGITLGYGFYQSSIGVGRRVDSASFSSQGGIIADRFYFISTDSTSYLNKYHFTELAVDLYTQYKLGNALSLRWRIGVGTAVLLAGNALHYDAGSGVLFKNRSLIPTIQMNVSSGADIGIGKAPILYIGPQLTYFLSKSSKQAGSAQHLFRAAIRATVGFAKKKK